MRNLLLLLCISLAVLTGCKQEADNGAKEMLKKAQTAYDEGRYDEALATIRQLRHEHPQAIEERKAALALFQEASLKQAQQELAQTDSLLEAAKKHHKRLMTQMKNNPYSKQMEHELTEARRIEDSLRVQWSTQGAKIRAIKMKIEK